MAVSPLAAPDLPLRYLARDDARQAKVSCHAPGWPAARHHPDPGLAGIDPLTGAPIARSAAGRCRAFLLSPGRSSAER
jgi:hypothetical protein